MIGIDKSGVLFSIRPTITAANARAAVTGGIGVKRKDPLAGTPGEENKVDWTRVTALQTV
jgi:hypothetical protein